MTIINFDDVIGKKFKTITNNVFCLNHPINCLVIGRTGSGKSNIVLNLVAKNFIYEKIHIYSNNIDDKYDWLKNKFKNDVFIYLDEINFDRIDKKYVNLIIFDDLVFSNKTSIGAKSSFSRPAVVKVVDQLELFNHSLH